MPNTNLPPIQNPELEEIIQEMKNGSNPTLQTKLTESLKQAKLLSPVDFDVQFKQEKDGKIQDVNPSQIKFYLINTNDGKTFFPIFTKLENTTKVNFGEDVHPKHVVRMVKDFDVLLKDAKNKTAGLIINPGLDNIVIPTQMVSMIAGTLQVPKPNIPVNPAPLIVRYLEPTVYPTKMAMAVYDRAETTEEIQRIWLKQKVVGNKGSFCLLVESKVENEHVLNEIREVAVPNAKNVPVEVVFVNERLMKEVVKEATPLYDRNLDL